MIEKVIAWKTKDGRVFPKRNDAIQHEIEIRVEKLLESDPIKNNQDPHIMSIDMYNWMERNSNEVCEIAALFDQFKIDDEISALFDQFKIDDEISEI